MSYRIDIWQDDDVLHHRMIDEDEKLIVHTRTTLTGGYEAKLGDAALGLHALAEWVQSQHKQELKGEPT